MERDDFNYFCDFSKDWTFAVRFYIIVDFYSNFWSLSSCICVNLPSYIYFWISNFYYQSFFSNYCISALTSFSCAGFVLTYFLVVGFFNEAIYYLNILIWAVFKDIEASFYTYDSIIGIILSFWAFATLSSIYFI